MSKEVTKKNTGTKTKPNEKEKVVQQKESKKAETVESTGIEVEDNTVNEENEKLKQELAEMKEMVKQLLESQKVQDSNTTPEEQDMHSLNDDIPLIPPNKLINITSLFYGGMTLRAANKNIRFDRFGVTLPVTFEDLTYISSNHRRLAEEGCFFIHSEDAVKSLYLSESYKNLANKQTIENLITLPHDKISSIYNNLTESLKETVQDIIIQGVISGDSKYLDRGKIDHVSKLCGKNLFQIAQDLRTE